MTRTPRSKLNREEDHQTKVQMIPDIAVVNRDTRAMKNIQKSTPASKRPSDFSLKSARNLLGQTSECHPKVFIKTFGWPVAGL